MAATKAKMQQAAATKKSAAQASITVVQDYYDLQLNELKTKGATFEVSKERAAELESLKLVKII